MTNLYTAADIEKQIWDFERIKVKLSDQNLIFSKKWTEVFRNALTNKEAVDGFRNRFNIFCLACRLL